MDSQGPLKWAGIGMLILYSSDLLFIVFLCIDSDSLFFFSFDFSWNAFGCNINEDKIMSMINAMVEKNLSAFGYQYIISMQPTTTQNKKETPNHTVH
jgi:hypothetical protein